MKFLHSLILISIPLVAIMSLKSMDDILRGWTAPVIFNQRGISYFFKNEFNQNLYGQQFLPRCFEHVVDFIDFGITRKKSLRYFDSVFEFFHIRAKECTWINTFALSNLLEKLSIKLQPVFNSNVFDQKKETRVCLFNSLKSDFNLLKNDPDKFFDKVTEEIYAIYKGNEEEPTIIEVQDNCARFIESLLDKVIWNPKEINESWESFLTLGGLLEELYKNHIIRSSKTLNHLIWSLTYRFCYFLDCWATDISADQYKRMKNFVTESSSSWLLLPERESFLTTKKERLLNALHDGQIRTMCATAQTKY